MKRILIWIFRIILIVVLAFAAFLLYSTLTDFKPPEQIDAITYDGVDTPIDSVFDLLIWNIGYAGLGEESDFFFDGGEMTRPSKEIVQKNIEGVVNFLESQKDVDFILLQEVDSLAKRSYKINEVRSIKNRLNEHYASFAINYNVKHVPKPFDDPLGKVVGGLLTLSKAAPLENTRYQFPGNFSWPVGLFFLDRCFLLQRFELANDKELVVINTHNSAYDDGSLKRQQMDFLKHVLQDEYDKGNYVVVGGDWNQNPSNFNQDLILDKYPIRRSGLEVDNDYLQGWNWIYDDQIPTNRSLNSAFNSEQSKVTVIDFYLASPNLEVVEVMGVDLEFTFSDHQPVYLKLKLSTE